MQFDEEALRHWAGQLAEDYLPECWELLGSTPHTRVAVNRDLGLYFKEYGRPSPMDSLLARFRGSRAARARVNAQALLRVGIDAPVPVFWGSLPGRREFLYTAAAPGENISVWLQTTLVNRSGEQLMLRRQLLSELGIFIGRVHATGFVHGNLLPDNILADRRHERFRFTLLDNEDNRILHPPPGRSLLRNLAQLNEVPPAYISRADRMRFFRAWRQQMRSLSATEADILAVESYRIAMQAMNDLDKL